MSIEQSQTQPFGAYYQCHKNPYATYTCLESFRKIYPDSTIVLVSDNGYNYKKMAEHFNCIYIHSNGNVPFTYHSNLYDNHNYILEQVNKLIQRFSYAMLLCKEEYIMWLEDDVSINSKIEDTFKYDINGYCPNSLSHKNIIDLKTKYIDLDVNKNYRFSGHGGSVINIKKMLFYFMNTDLITDIIMNWRQYYFSNDVAVNDFFFSLIVNIQGGTVGPYIGHMDCYYKNEDIPVQHQYKVFYNTPLPDHLQHLCSFE
jgi:hypothetical protein